MSIASTSSQPTQRQTRGPTWMHGDWNPGGGMLHIVPNELNQTVEGHTPLASHLGVLARNGSLLPLTYKSWHYVPKENKERIWREIKANTDADDSMKRMLMSSTGKKWREWKCTVKKSHYKAFTNDAERLAHRPERVHEHQWRALVYYWGTRKARKKAKKNKRIRKKETLHHRTGRKPFVVVRLEETKRNKEVPASRMQVWKAAYLKEGSLASDAVNEVMALLSKMSLEVDIYRRSQEQTHIFQAQMQEQFQLYRVQFETQMKEMMETQMAAMCTQMDTTIQAQATTIQTQQTRMEYLESQLVTRGGPAAREAAWGHHPMSRPQQNSHEFTSSSSHQKVAQSKTKNKSKSKRRPHI
ncbi:hypothetical protein RHGRI_014767 [Rhododendron griersonianum]|uniref:Uncharacterized protein n=1 Tax=Rhododendron griersonianum TaxID=479676 RepID=A0AAV6KB16_9ERIC|nr:hypothetical protein RHGRI_014767 [Rhododendron griersonianum]